jgi:hypothetical protein
MRVLSVFFALLKAYAHVVAAKPWMHALVLRVLVNEYMLTVIAARQFMHVLECVLVC